MNKEKITLYSSAALDRLGQLGAALVGLSAFAYIAGYFKLKHIYSTVGADWVMSFTSTEDILRAGLGPMALFGLSIVACVFLVGNGTFVKTKIATFLIFTAILLFALRPDILLAKPETPRAIAEYNLSYSIANFLYSTSGALLVYGAYRFLLNGLESFTLTMCATALALGLYFSPVYLGQSWGRAAIADDTSFLPWVKSTKDSDNGWRLLGNVGGKYLLMSNRTAQTDTYFQLVEIGPDWKIRRGASFKRSE